MDKTQTQTICPICLEEFETGIHTDSLKSIIVLLDCSHMVCKPCFLEMSKSHASCPMCKSEILMYQDGESTSLYSKPNCNEIDEDFLLYTHEDFIKELHICETRLSIISSSKFLKWNSNPKQHEATLYNHTKDLIVKVLELLEVNTVQNHYDKNKEILQLLQEIVKYIDKLSSIDCQLSNEDMKKIESKSDQLYEIQIPKQFEKVRHKKSLKKHN